LLQLVWNDISELQHLKDLQPIPARRPESPSIAKRALDWAAAAATRSHLVRTLLRK
jgi:hypothetical protein